MNEISAVRLKMKSELPSRKDLYEMQLDDAFWSLVDVVGVGNASNFALDVVENALTDIMKTDETN